MRKVVATVVLVGWVVSLSGCVSLSRSEKTMLRELEGYGISKTEEKVKSAPLAGALNLLPGIGNFYLAAGTDEGSQALYGVLNLLTWPLSILWGVPQAAIDAGTINKQETIYYYQFNPQGKKELEALKAQQN